MGKLNEMSNIMTESYFFGKNKIEQLIEEMKKGIVFFDFDGTLCEFRFSENKVLDLPNKEYFNYYEHIRPLYFMQSIVEKLDPDKVYILTQITKKHGEDKEKIEWLHKYYPLLKDNHFYTVRKHDAKGLFLQKWCEENKINPNTVYMIEDSTSNIRHIEDLDIGIKCYHITSLIG